jgi:hypothetical protein
VPETAPRPQSNRNHQSAVTISLQHPPSVVLSHVSAMFSGKTYGERAALQSARHKQFIWLQLSMAPVAKHSGFPSARWMALISSVLIMFPGLTPLCLAISLILRIFIFFTSLIKTCTGRKLSKLDSLKVYHRMEKQTTIKYVPGVYALSFPFKGSSSRRSLCRRRRGEKGRLLILVGYKSKIINVTRHPGTIMIRDFFPRVHKNSYSASCIQGADLRPLAHRRASTTRLQTESRHSLPDFTQSRKGELSYIV